MPDPAETDRRALDQIAEMCGARPGDRRDDVVRAVRDMLTDPAVHNARRSRTLAVVERLTASLQGLIEDSPDPGTEALGAVWEGAEFLRQGGGRGALPDVPRKWQPIPAAVELVWADEGRSGAWKRVVRRLHGADAVDNHGLSIADAERLATAAVDEISVDNSALVRLAVEIARRDSAQRAHPETSELDREVPDA